MEKVLISSCLLGLKTRFDGEMCFDPRVKTIEKKYTVIPLCPEILGGLSTPRKPATIEKGDGKKVWEENIPIVLRTGEDVSHNFRKGAQQMLDFAKFLHVKRIILKENSPSCGLFCTNVSFERVKGIGVTAYLLKKNGFILHTIASFLERNP